MMTAAIPVIWFVLFTILGWYVAYEKRRSPWEGFIFGILLGPFGLLIVACLAIGDLPGPGPTTARPDFVSEPVTPDASAELTDEEREAVQREFDRDRVAPDPRAIWLPNRPSKK
jgi:hypothetical protein